MITQGSKVVCVDAINWRNGNTVIGSWPVKGKVYVVSGFYISARGSLGIKLIGKQTFGISGNEVGFRASRFRELEEYRQAQELAYYKALPVHAPEPVGRAGP